MSGVIGSLGLGGVPTLACLRLIPVNTYSSSGIDLSLKGSPSPSCIWVNRMPDRYDFMVRCLMFCWPKNAAKRDSVCSVTGNACATDTEEQKAM